MSEKHPVRLLVTGRNGQLATALARLAGPDMEVLCLGRPDLDITDRASLDDAVTRLRPDLIVNAAAFTAVDRAEAEVHSAMAVNATGAGNVAAAAASRRLPVIHISTDYVFSGEASEAYVETDPTVPLNVYGRSKLEGERAVAEANSAHVILRTGWVYAPWGTNFALTMMRLAAERDTVRVVDDQIGTPNYAPHLAQGIVHIARHVLRNPDAAGWRGVFHIAAEGRTSWAGFAERLFLASKSRGGPCPEVVRIRSEEYPTPAARPRFSVLSTRKLRETFRLSPPHWESGAEEFVAAL